MKTCSFNFKKDPFVIAPFFLYICGASVKDINNSQDDGKDQGSEGSSSRAPDDR